MTEAVIEKLVHGGQGLGTLEDGRKAFVWNALPGEKVNLEVRKSKNKYLEGVATEIIEASSERIEPRDEAFLSTSPWQIMTFAAENKYKQEILVETLSREHVTYDAEIKMHTDDREWHYRNKMEYSFWGDDDGLHLALFHRASHGKRIITGSSIAMAAIDDAANKVVAILNKHGISRTRQLRPCL
jgi:23S rRNA (uracil1939-C5)-methyltransferase